ncbi:BolA family protein [Ferrigenium sp. UT5]|uniref:BolA family protein n=1 Tax=Ferrigenium sp. UT5 TaxID=3242105 RepID=UPI00354B3224
MKTTPQNVADFIREGLPCEHIHVEGDGRHFEAVIVSSQFEGKGMLQQHKLVYQVLGNRMERIHALSMKTMTPAQWANQQ